jgi:non-ribosomal peptide synthetase component E (peptide arylation enzyme)
VRSERSWGIALVVNYGERQARVVDDDLKDVEPGDQGECLVRGNTIFM